MSWIRFKACVKCRGDLVLDEGDWLCLQCGTYYYTGLYREGIFPSAPQQVRQDAREQKAVPVGQILTGVYPAGEICRVACDPRKAGVPTPVTTRLGAAWSPCAVAQA